MVNRNAYFIVQFNIHNSKRIIKIFYQEIEVLYRIRKVKKICRSIHHALLRDTARRYHRALRMQGLV